MTASGLDSDYIAAALPAFISEAQEQLEQLEQLLLQLEDRPDDRELLDALFRCAHTIKGSAGIFGLDDVVAFTHHVETLLDAVRQGRVKLTPELSTLLLQSTDQVRQLVEAATEPTDASGQRAGCDADSLATRAALVQQLQAASGEVPAATRAGHAAQAASPTAAPVPLPPARPCWRIAVRFHADTFRNGMDPLAILNYVAKLGTLGPVSCAFDDIPDLAALDPESCHLGFEMALDSEATRSEIEAAFSFVRDDCTLEITEPQPVGVTARIEALPDNARLGDILVAAGAVSRAQVQQALRVQSTSAEAGAPKPPLGEILQQQSGLSQQLVTAALQKQAKPRQAGAAGAPAGGDNRYIRVQADRLDAVINLLGELVIAGAGATLLARQTRQTALIEANDQISQLIEEIRNGTLQLRMVPIGETFTRFRRVVRDTAAELKKDVALEITGAETELDKSVVERIADPLMHLVRNALDHGLEAPAEREAAGKPPQGTLTLSACHEAGSILIRILDDGRGIQRDKVLARAWERGIVEQGVVPPDDEVLKLIFEPGFSTAEKVTNLSGRGVGMDVVRSNIEALRGTVNLSSTPGQGSCIEIRLPLTLAIIDGFLVGVGSSRFILPLDGVVEVIENRPTRLDARGCATVELRGQVLPVVSLRALYALDSAPPERCSIVVVQAGTRRFGVMVDQLHGQHQTVIKPLARMFRSLRGISGSSILGNGEVALIFDIASLAQVASDAADSVSRSPRGPGVAGRPATTSLEG